MSAQDDPGDKRQPEEPHTGVLKIKPRIGKVTLISMDHIILAEANDHYIKLYYMCAAKMLQIDYRSSMKKLHKKLPPTSFRRLNRSYIVNDYQLNSFEEETHSFLTNCGEIIKLRRRLGIRRI